MHTLFTPSNASHRSIRANRRRSRASMLAEALESRTLLSSTLFVTAPDGPSDATHYQTLQNALAFAVDGDTIVLQPGMAGGDFGTATMNGSAFAGGVSFMTSSPLVVSEIVTIGAGTDGDQAERAMISSVTPSIFGGFIVTLASPLQFDHDNSPVSALNPGSGGPTVGINKAVTIVTSENQNITLPFNLEVWPGTTGVTIGDHVFTPENPAPVDPTPPAPDAETIVVSPHNFTITKGGMGRGSVAHFTDNKAHRTSDFAATVTFSDGVVLTGRVFRGQGGRYEVVTCRKFDDLGNVTFAVSVSTSGARASGQGTVSVLPRVLTAQGMNVTTDSKMLACKTVATFTDNLKSFGCGFYKVNITWSDGVKGCAVVCRNGEGSFSVKTSRFLPGPGTLTGHVDISTCDGTVTTSADFTLTIVAPPVKSPYRR